MNKNLAVNNNPMETLLIKTPAFTGIIMVTYAQVKANKTVFKNPAFLVKANCFTGQSGTLYNKVNITEIITMGNKSGKL